MTHIVRSIVILAIAVSAAVGFCAEPASTYDRAASLSEQGKSKEASALLKDIEADARRVQINATIIICAEDFRKAMDKDTQAYVFEAKSMSSLPATCSDKEGVVNGVAQGEDRASLLVDLVQQSDEAGVASIFGIQVFETQVVRVSLVPDAQFPVLDSEGKQEYALVRKKNKVEKVFKTARKPVHFAVRPILADSGKLILEFGPKQNKIDPFPAVPLTQTVPWTFPGRPRTHLREPELGELKKAGPVRIHLDSRGYLLLSGMRAQCAEEVSTGVPLLQDMPLIGKAFRKSSTVQAPPAELYVLLEFRIQTR